MLCSVNKNNQQMGPFADGAVLEMLRAGHLSPERLRMSPRREQLAAVENLISKLAQFSTFGQLQAETKAKDMNSNQAASTVKLGRFDNP